MNKKLAQMLLYVAHRLTDDPRNGRTKLHKILFFSDFSAYRQTGRSISGEDYVKFDRGPFLPSIDTTVSKMTNANLASWAAQNQQGEIRLVPFRPDRIATDLISPAEREIIDGTVERFWGWSADAISNLTHRMFGWMTTPNGQVIPYNSAYVGVPRPLGDDDNAWALDLIGRYREWKRAKAEYCP